MAPVWLVLGRAYRAGCRVLLPGATVRQHVGEYGPFRLNANFTFSNFANWGSGHNNAFSATVEACRDKKCVFDIGGHIGLVTLPMSKVIRPDGIVVTFEPGCGNLRYLRQHLKSNQADNVEVVEKLVGANDGTITFYEKDGDTGQNSVVVKKDHDTYHEVTRDQVRLDTFCNDRRLSPEVIKIDVEGAEFDVLSGARETLRTCQPMIFLSVHPKELELLGSSVDALADLIDDLGYQCTEIDGTPITEFRLAEYLMTTKNGNTTHVD